MLLGAGVASLVGVGFAFLKAQESGGSREVLLEAMGIVTIVLSWLIVHTTFTLRYAHLYYMGDRAGGIDFKQGSDYEPDYRDFAYTAFTVGMTYQVSDTDITKSRDPARRVAPRAVVVLVRRGDHRRDRQHRCRSSEQLSETATRACSP